MSNKNTLSGTIWAEQFASKSDLQELEEAMTQKMLTAGSGAADLIPEVSDPDIVKYTVYDCPFLTRLQSLGQVQNHTSANVTTRVKVSGTATTAIGETDDVPSDTPSVYDKSAGLMTTYVTPINISLMAQKGAQDVINLVEDEHQDAVLDHWCTLNQDMIVGDGTGDTLTGLKTAVTTNTENMNGDQITDKKQIDDLFTKVRRAGGKPTALLTTANVQEQLEAILYPRLDIIPQVDMAFGYNVNTYKAPNGMTMPIIVDDEVPYGSDQDELYVLTERSLRLKQLMYPTVLPVPTQKLATSDVIASFDYFQIRGERFNGRMYNIGSG